ncbi:MAG: YgjP-like metallopeptidase domain-containing protein, partial [Pseudomonadota bacterium]
MTADAPTTIILASGPAALDVRVNRRARRLILKVDPVRRRIIVTAPSKRAVREAIAFARSRSDWIEAQLDPRFAARPFANGEIAPLRGDKYALVASAERRRAVRIVKQAAPGAPGLIEVGGDPAHFNRRVIDWMKREARSDLAARVDAYCARLGKRRGPIS